MVWLDQSNTASGVAVLLHNRRVDLHRLYSHADNTIFGIAIGLGQGVAVMTVHHGATYCSFPQCY